MALLTNILNGKLNLDQQEYRVPEGDYVDALNIIRDSRGDAKDTVVANLDGNTWVLYQLPFGVNKCIGQYPDKLRNRVYMFIWNSVDHDLILIYYRDSNSIVKLIENMTDSANVDILDFNPSKKINHIDVIYRDESEGDLLFWTDGNSSPKKLNVNTILAGTLGPLEKSFIELAKAPPLYEPTCVYGTDLNIASNSLRRKLFQFSYRWIYDDFEKSTFSTYSKVPLPIGAYDTDIEVDNVNNNFITVTVQTGKINVTGIEIAVRFSQGTAGTSVATWSDFVTIASLDKDQLVIADNTSYQFLFYNDSLYPPIPLAEQTELFDWVPQLADGQVMANGNIPVYGAITEGYDNYPTSQLDVTITAANVTNGPTDPTPPAMTYVQHSGIFTFTISGTVPVGTLYRVTGYVNVPPLTVMTLAEYTSVFGDTTATVAVALFAYLSTHHSSYAGSQGGSDFEIDLPFPGSSILASYVSPGGGGGGAQINTEKTWLWNSNYIFGLVYVDDQNRDIPGVTTYSNPINTDNDFTVTTPQFSELLGVPQTPVITATINHTPPDDAVRYYWVRRRQTYGDFLMYETCDFQEDADYYYFCLSNVATYHTSNSNFIYSEATVTAESRIKVMAKISGGAYNGTVWTQDYFVLGTVIRTLTTGSSPANDKPFIKVNKPTSVSPAYSPNMLVMLYVPPSNPTSEEDSVYWEWGESYSIYESGGVHYHRGLDQDQTAIQPATFTWEEGDVYFHPRVMNNSDLTSPTTDTLYVMDTNFSDFFPSSVNDNGRGQAIEANARQSYIPALVRFGQAYQSGTNVNQTNRFYFANFDEYDRSVGAIRKMFIEGRNLFIFQQFDIGVVPVLTQIVKDTSNNPLQANSDQLLNKIMYPYVGKFGIGDVPESFAYGKHAKYGVDNNKGVAWRLSQDGLTPLSVIYQCNNFFVTTSEKYNDSYNNGYTPSGLYLGDPTIYGVYNEYSNRVIWAFEEITRYNDPASLGYTIQIGIGGKNIFFSGTPDPGLSLTLNMSAANGDTGIATYNTDSGHTVSDVRQGLFVSVNLSAHFTATKVTDPTTHRLGLLISNNSLSLTTISLSMVGSLSYHQDPHTISFNESRGKDEGFESMYSYHPEFMGSLNNLFYTFINGQFWAHENGSYCNFYGAEYGVMIKPVFNEASGLKKTYISIVEYANAIWPCTEIKTQLNTFGSTPQRSRLVEQEFKLLEGDYHSSFRRDENSPGGLYNGWALKGNYIIITLSIEQAPNFVYLNAVAVKYINSPLNNS